ncbi:MAG: hypothetical protein BGO95_07800 [Micrococcales bacterium 73-13]|nr:MAG: hypothetical protein BGO95_07800 [Micrococcales bacterium 73-13]
MSTGAEITGTSGADYAHRLHRLQSAWWKRLIRAQAPYHADVRRLRLGATLDIGCGPGRLLQALPPRSVGVDHNPHLVRIARERGLPAYTVEEFAASPELARPARYDTLLVAHLVEHLEYPVALELMRGYLPYLRPGGRVMLITPQERGFDSDPTHLAFADFDVLRRLCADLALSVEREWSFPFPRWAGRPFVYNEFHLLASMPEVAG